MVLTLIRASRKTTLNCTSALSVCLVPNVHCKRSQQLRTICTCVLTDFSLTVKAATLIFISGRGSAISSAKEGKSGFIYNLVKS